MNIREFKSLPIMGILRGIKSEILEPLIETVISSGLRTLEITMNTENAPQLIKQAVQISNKRLAIGAGTVLSVESLKAAVDSGATFIVTPVLVEEVTQHCVKNNIPVFPGAFAPLEIYNAWKSGATMVKVFPTRVLGPEYFREAKGPFNDIELMACGGVTPENLKTYLNAGASAVTFGSGVFKEEWLQKKDFQSIGNLVKEFIQACPAG